MRRLLQWLITAGACSVAGATLTPVLAQNFDVTNLGPVDALAMNERAEVIGVFGPQMAPTAFRTGANGLGIQTINMPASSAGTVFVHDIDEQGKVFGALLPPGGYRTAWSTDAGGANAQFMSYPSEFIGGSVVSTNENGQMIAVLRNPNRSEQLTLIDGSKTVALPFYQDYYRPAVMPVINESGMVAGTLTTGFDVASFRAISRAFVADTDGNVIRILDTLGGLHSYSAAVNDAGQVAGSASTASGAAHAFVSGTTGGEIKDLGTLGGDASYALSINELGWVVGYSETEGPSTTMHPFLWREDGQGMIDLATFLPEANALSRAVAINNKGQVLVQVLGGNSYLLTPSPIPEPRSAMLMFCGLLAMAVASRRRTSLG